MRAGRRGPGPEAARSFQDRLGGIPSVGVRGLTKSRTTHVGSKGGRLSDAGSIPAASTLRGPFARAPGRAQGHRPGSPAEPPGPADGSHRWVPRRSAPCRHASHDPSDLNPDGRPPEAGALARARCGSSCSRAWSGRLRGPCCTRSRGWSPASSPRARRRTSQRDRLLRLRGAKGTAAPGAGGLRHRCHPDLVLAGAHPASAGWATPSRWATC